MPEEGSQCTCLLAILIISKFRIGKSYYPHMFLEEWKYIFKEKKMTKYINADICASSSDSAKVDSDEKSSGKGNSNEKYSDEIYEIETIMI